MPIVIGVNDPTGLGGYTATPTDPHVMLIHPSMTGVLPVGEKFTSVGLVSHVAGEFWEVGIYDITGGIASATLIASATVETGAGGTLASTPITPAGTSGNTYAVAFRPIGTARARRVYNAGNTANLSNALSSSPLSASYSDSATNNDDRFGFFALSEPAGPSITAPDPTDGTQSTITASGLTAYSGGTLAGVPIALSGTLPNLLYTPSWAGLTAVFSAARLGESATLAVTGPEGTATTSVTPQVKAGYAVTTLTSVARGANKLATNLEAALAADGTPVTVAIGDQIYFPTANATLVDVDGELATNDAGYIQMYLGQGGNATTPATWYPFQVQYTEASGSEVKIIRGMARAITRSLIR